MILRFSVPKPRSHLFLPLTGAHNSLLFFILIVSYLLLLLFSQQGHAAPAENHLMNCDIQYNACTLPLGNGTVTFDILPKPVKAMADLTFQLTLKNIATTKLPYIDLGMPGMKMGPNRVPLKSTEDGATFTGNGIIVRCPSGRTVWKAIVTVPDAGSVEYVFNVND